MFASRFRRTCGCLFLAIAAPTGVLCSASRAALAAEVSSPSQRAASSLGLRESQTVTTRYSGSAISSSARPVALASGDFDQDGVPDLISGYARSRGGVITLHRGNIDALWPYGAALRNGTPPAFLPDAKVFSLPEAPDFLATGDFDADGHYDVVTAQRGSNALYLLRGNGHGGFYSPQRIPIAGTVTAMISGEVNRADGLTDLIVAVNTANGARALVFESPRGALQDQPEMFKLPHPATALALARFDGGAMNDLAVAAGNQMVVIHARDRKLAQSESQRATVAPAKVTVQNFPYAIQAIAAGDFTGTGPSIALLGGDGSVHILDHAVTPTGLAARLIADPNYRPTIQVGKAGPDGKKMAYGGTMTPGMTSRLAALRQAAKSSSSEWTERTTIALPAGFSQSVPRLVAARVSGSFEEDILAVDSGNSKIHVLSTLSGTSKVHAAVIGRGAVATVAPTPMRLLTSISAPSAPAVVLPMRLNQHGLNGLVTLQAGQTEPTVMPQDVPPANVFTVTNTSDAIIRVGPAVDGPDGSLRHAIYNASIATGTSSIVFNIPTTDPGYNSATGAFLIQPLSEAAPGAFNNFALPPINATVTIDGYTQPGASPNTLANGDNAKILIQIDGTLATTPGGSGLVPFDDNGSTYRGLAFTGWINPEISTGSSGGETASGAEGMEANGVGDFIEGNFFGTDTTGKVAAPNRTGIFADNGPLFGSAPGNIIGGTTPQARNILSGNNDSGVLFLSIAFEAELQGNFIGLDVTGNTIRSNTFDGAGLNGPTVTIGGTLPGTANVIAGNGTNVDINDLTEGGQATDSTVQGNLIGTNAAGTSAIPAEGYGVSILHNPTDMTIGGTTPAARNVISGNLAGVYIFDNAFNNIVEGNYIGVDITGAAAVPNVNQGFITGSTDPSELAAGDTTIGGAVPGAGNVISGNTLDGIQISGTSNGPSGTDSLQGNTVLGNFIGTDASGTAAVPNGGSGVDLIGGASNNIIGGTNPGSGNLIANNVGNGVLIDPGTAVAGEGVGNNTIANTILSNGGAGVRVVSGTGNRISQNSIFANGALGIDIDIAGPDANTHCNSSNTGANNLQNSPLLTAGTGTAFISATATDPNGNTSEFSNAVQASQAGNILSLLGTFDSTPNTAFTIEFFSNTVADPSGFGQGQTYLGSTTVTTNATCTVPVANPIDLTTADVSVTLASDNSAFAVGPDFGYYTYTGTVANNGPAAADNVVFTDTLPSSLAISSAYCDVGFCQIPVTTSLGTCTVSGNTLTCNLGSMAPGATADISFPVQALTTGSIANTATVTATQPDPNLANNTSTSTVAADYPDPFIDHLDPSSSLVNPPAGVPMTIYGNGFVSGSTVTFNGTSLPVLGLLDNQVCGGPFEPGFCAGLQVLIPASLLTTAGAPNVTVTNPDPGEGGGANLPSSSPFTIASSCSYTVSSDLPVLPETVENDGTTLIADQVGVLPNAPTCAWTATSSVPWAVVLDNASSVGYGNVDIAIAPNTAATPRTGSVTVAGQTFSFQQDPSSSCSYTLGSAPPSYSAAGGTGTLPVTPNSSSCAPFVVSFAPWITIPESSGLLIENNPAIYTVAANTGAPRTGSVMIGGDVITITQDAPPCYFTLSANSANLPVAGGTGSIGVTASAPSCAWTAAPSNSALVSITSGASGTGNGTVNYSMAANTAGPQTPTITIGNQTGNALYTINQSSALTCTFTISPTPLEVGSSGTTNFFTITASYSFCRWTATSNDPAALSLTNATSGAGTAGIFYAVGQNDTGAPRTLTITAGCQTFTVNQDGAAASNPTPAITTLLPASAIAGSGAFTLTVNGSGFVSGSVVNFNGNARATTFVSATQLTAAILGSDVASAGAPPVTVTNPTPGGGVSNTLTFTVTGTTNNPVPVITTLQPASAAAGSAAFTLTVNGSNFVSGSVVNFNGTPRTTTFVSATQVTAAIMATDIAAVGTPSVTVTDPTPGGGISNAVTFNVTPANNPVPAISTLQPSGVTAGAAAFSLTVSGTGFVNGSTVNFNGSPRTTTFVSATQVMAAITAADVANAGNAAITVINPAPGGGTSNTATFTITAANNPVPAITNLQPASGVSGQAAFTLTVNGSGFVKNSVVNFGGNARATTFVSATQVTAAILASDIATAGTATITVTNPAPGGGTSNAVSFVIVQGNPVPAITSLVPTHAPAGAGFTLTINGTNFLSNSTVSFNGKTETTTFVSGTELTVAISATDAATGGTVSVVVTNPAPGGGASPGTNFILDDYNVTGPAGTVTVVRGGAPVTITITLTPTADGYSDPVQLSVSGLAAGLTGVFTEPTITPGTTTTTTTLTITTPATTTTTSQLVPRAPQSRFPGAPVGLLAIVLPGGLLFARKSWRALFPRWAAVVLWLALLGGVGGFLSGCGGGFQFGPNTTKDVITVTATSGTDTHTTQIALGVQ